MKKKLFALMMGVGLAFGAVNVSAKACHCEYEHQECLAQGNPLSMCFPEYLECMDNYCRF